MKNKLKVIVIVISLLFLLTMPAFVKAAPSNNPIFATIEVVQQMIIEALAPIQEGLENLRERVSNTESDLSSLPGQIDELRISNATLSASVLDLQQRVSALEGESSSDCTEMPTGLISWWPGNGNANDVAGSNNGTLTNGATFTGGKVGQAFSFDGVDDHLQSTTINLPTGNNNRTLEMWIRINAFLADVPDPHSPLETFFVGYGNFGSSNQIYTLGAAGNILYFSQWGNALFGPSLQTDRWYHVAVTNVGDSATLYLNGTVVANGVLGINTPASTSFYIGRAPGSFGEIRRMNGLVDEVSIYNRALISDEIKSIFDAGNNGKCPQLMGFSDDFNGSTLDMNKWEFFSTNGGNYNFDNGSIVVPGGTSMFYIRTKNNPFPPSGPFTAEFGIQYTTVDESGVGVAVGFEQQNGYDPNNVPIAYWQGSNFGLQVVRFGLTEAMIGSNPDLNYHIGKIHYDGDKYQIFLDGVFKYTSPSSATAKSLWFGNPFCCRNNWTGFKLDYIKVTIL